MTDCSRRRIYGAEPDPSATPPGHEYVQLLGGPLDGQLLNITGFTREQRVVVVHLLAPHTIYGPGGRVVYVPAVGRPDGVSVWAGDVP